MTGYTISFAFVCPKNEDSIIKSFINTFKNKYLEPNPKAYDKEYGGKTYTWEGMSDKDKEYAYMHHRSNMLPAKILLEQVKENLNTAGIEDILCRYGFYHTNYGIGIFVLFSTIMEMRAVQKMNEYLKQNNIPFSNEFSDAKWVYRFVMNISKDIHGTLLNNFNAKY